MDRLKALLAGARRRRPALDHLLRAYARYSADAGDRLAAAVTYYWFLSLFPILLLAVSLLGYVYGDASTQKVQDALGDVLPSQLVQTLGETLQEARGPAGVLGVLGTLYAGLGWIDALREAVRSIWHQNVQAGNLVVKKLRDAVALVGLIGTIATSVVVSGLATAFSTSVLDALGIEATAGARFFTRALAYALALLGDTLLFLYLLGRLARVNDPWRRLLRGAVFGAVGFEVLKVVGAVYVERTTSRGAATYGTFAVVVGLLLFLYLFSRLLLFTAAWTVTAPYDSDVAPSGTASPDLARRSGIPEEFADGGPDDPPTLLVDGAPSRLQAAVRGTVPPQDEPTPAGAAARRPAPATTSAPAQPPGATAVVTAAHVAAGAVGTLVAGVLVHALGTTWRTLRRR